MYRKLTHTNKYRNFSSHHPLASSHHQLSLGPGIKHIPYIKGTSEAITRVLSPLGIRTTFRPYQHFMTPKDQVPQQERPGVVYRIAGTNCWHVLEKYGIPPTLLSIIRSLHDGMKAEVTVDGNLTL